MKKINLELNDDEELILSEAFESAIAECYFTEIEDQLKLDYFSEVQKLINKFGLEVKVESVIEELIELNESDDDFDEEDNGVIDITDDDE